ncbi:flagellar hook protein FlgE [Selenomonas sp. AB3002]|uniref:flagellar hook protein FlgE n=1 Tax=Selenomonas sp. AB3002 TaxID=1392502 RepID=UPI0004985275
MMRSLFSGVSGLKNHQTRMDVIGNNISNVNTTGFKSSRVTFADTLNQTMSGAAAPTGTKGGVNAKQVGLGSGVASVDLLFSDGSVQSTGKNTDLCISGNGLFVVKDNKQTYYTRNGDFEFDADGNYVMPGSGLKVQGWMADDSGALSTTGPTTDIVVKLGQTMAAEATSTATYTNNLDADVPVITSYSFVKPSDGTTHTETTAGKYIGASSEQPVTLYFSDGSKMTVNSGRYVIGRSMPQTTAWTYYDSLGVEHTSTVLFEKSVVADLTYTNEEGNPVTKKATAWVMSLPEATVNEADGSTSTYTLGSTTITFDYDGIIREGTFSGTETLVADTNSEVTITTPPGALDGDSVKKSSLSVTHTAPNGSSTPQSISLELGDLTQYAGMNTINGDADGNAAGSLESISIDSSGVIMGTYTNSVQKAEAQVAIAQFTNASGLTKTGSSLYQTSNNSGAANVKTATDLGVKITPSALEMSNVDIANEFADMIITQRGFQSNSKIVTVGDEMLETVINMKR